MDGFCWIIEGSLVPLFSSRPAEEYNQTVDSLPLGLRKFVSGVGPPNVQGRLNVWLQTNKAVPVQDHTPQDAGDTP